MTRAVLFIHGFTGSTNEVQPLVDYLEERQKEWIYATPTLTGHGEQLNLKGIQASHWMRDVENAYRELEKQADEIIVIGFSMGGVLALYLALRYKVEKIVLLSTAIKYIDVKKLFELSKKVIKNRKKLKETEKNLIKSNLYRAKHMSFPTVKNFTSVVHQVAPYLSKIQQPVLIVQGMQDGLVPSETATYIFENIASVDKEIYFSESGYHQICFSEDRLQWFRKVERFLSE